MTRVVTESPSRYAGHSTRRAALALTLQIATRSRGLPAPARLRRWARAALARALGCAEDWVGVATQEEGFVWRDLN